MADCKTPGWFLLPQSVRKYLQGLYHFLSRAGKWKRSDKTKECGFVKCWDFKQNSPLTHCSVPMCKSKAILYPLARVSFLFYTQLRHWARNRGQGMTLPFRGYPRSLWYLWQNFWIDSVSPTKHQPEGIPWSKQKCSSLAKGYQTSVHFHINKKRISFYV